MIENIKRAAKSAISRLPAEFLKNLKWQYVGNLGVGIIGGLYFLYLGRTLGVAGFGLYALCLSVATLVFGLSDMRVQEAVIHFVSVNIAKNEIEEATTSLRTLFLLDIGVRLVGFVAACALSPVIALYIVKDGSTAWLVCLAAAGLMLGKAGFNPATGVLRLTDRFDLTAILQLVDWTGRFAVTLVLAALVDLRPMHILLVAALVGGGMNVALITVAARTWTARYGALSWRGPAHMIRRLGTMRKFVVSSHGINVVEAVVRDLDTTIIGMFASVPAVGLYRMVKNMAQLLWRCVDPIFLVLMPILSRFLLADDRERLRGFLNHLTVLSIVLASLLVGGANLVLPLLIRQFLPQFTDSISLIPWMTWWVLIALPLVWTHALAAAAGRPDIQFRASLVGNLLGAVLILTLTPLLSTTGAAIGWSLSLAVTFGLGYFLLKREKLL